MIVDVNEAGKTLAPAELVQAEARTSSGVDREGDSLY